jgi:hypothetical protein
MRGMGSRRILRDNGLTLTVLALFLLCLAGNAWFGYREHADEQREHDQPAPSFVAYLTSGHFLESVAENWESEFLQMGLFVILTAFLYQKGSPESHDPDQPDDSEPAEQREPRPWPARRGGAIAALYSHSLGMVFLLLFVASFALHAWAGERHLNDEREQHGKPSISLGEYVRSSQFWFESMQNWQSEFLSIAAMVFLSVYLRERGSAQSKRITSPHSAHE